MLPGRAVEMQQDGMSVMAIAEALGVTVQQVVSWWGYMGYDPVAHHIETIARQVQDGTALYDALTACGIGWHSTDSPHGSQRRIRERLEDGEMLCTECDIITAADPSGLCPDCRKAREYQNERAAELDFEAHWWERNFVKVEGKR
jgi:hypothetical protein